MRLVDVQVRDFRGLKGPVTVAFAEGLNVVHGPNETGKTTLFDAVRAVLTLKAKISEQKALQRIQPRGGGTPQVQLRFVHGGAAWTLQKTWTGNVRGTTRLVAQRGGDVVESLQGDDAEDRLRDLLGLSDPGRGERKQEHLGLWPLLWVEQGGSGRAPGELLTDTSRQALTQSLSETTQLVLGGDVGDEVLRRAEAEEAKYWTATRQVTRESAPLPAAERALEEAEQRLAQLRVEGARAEQDETDLARIEQEMRDLARQLPGLEGTVAEAEAAAMRAVGLAREAEAAEQASRRCSSDVQRATLILQARAERIAALAAARRALADEQGREAELRRRAEASGLERHAARRMADDARSAAEAAASTSRRLRDAVSWTEARAERDSLSRALADVRALEESLRELEATHESDPATPEWGGRIEEMSDAARAARLRLEAAAARVEIAALGSSLRVATAGDTHELKPGEPLVRELVDTWEAEIGGVARLRVRPGGEDLDALRRAASSSEHVLAEALAECRCSDAGAARRAVERRTERGHEIARLRKEMKRAAPKGSTALAAAHATAVARVAELSARLGLEADADALQGLPADVVSLRVELEDAERLESAARDRAAATDAAASAADVTASEATGEHRSAAVALSRREDEVGARELALAEHVATAGDDEALSSALANAEAAEAAAREGADSARRAAEAPDVSAAPERLARARRARQQAEAQGQDLQRRRAVLVDRLEKGSGGGLAEKVAGAEAVVASRRRERDAELARAEAARCLAEVLRGAREELQQRFHEPLRREIEPLLALLFPKARATFDAELGLDALHRGLERDGFADLSGGTQEQVGVIVRLGLARVLAKDDGLFVLLDEPLNDTDRARLDAMQTVLTRCADKLQIIVSTSQLDRWRPLGAGQLIDLAALRG